MNTPRISLSEIKKNFGQHVALNNLTFDLEPGKVLALLGDNGAGKSTLIKIISGYHKPTSGKLYWEGQCLNHNDFGPKEARSLGIQTVYQHLGLVDELSIARNFFLGVEPVRAIGPFKWLDRTYMREVVKKELSALGVKRSLDPDESVKKLSGGERQAIAISRARFFGAKLLILDEPTSFLSLRQTQEVLNYISHAASLGISVIFITHTLHHIERIVDKVAILYQGQCVGCFDAGALTDHDCAQLIVHGSKNSAAPTAN